MKPLTLLTSLMALSIIARADNILPKHPAMFPGMIVRCDDQGKCRWECEFGVVTETTVNENLIVKPSGCAPKQPPEIIRSYNPWQTVIPL